MEKKVSIIIPVYNAEKTIEKCLDSILGGTFSDYKIIAINDGSTDGSWKILENYKEKFPEKIRIFNQENQGVAKTRNAGLGYSTSKYIMFIDCDDWVDSDYLERFIGEAETGNSDMVIGGYRRITNEKILYKASLKNTEWSKYMIMAPWSRVYKRSFLSENKIEFLNNIGEDIYFNLQAINLTSNVSIINYTGYNWFFNKQSISNKIKKESPSKFNVMFLLDSCYDKLGEIGAAQKKEVEFYFLRYIIWYILFIGRRYSYNDINLEFISTFNWLKNKFPEFEKNKNISLIHPSGETMRNKFIVYVFFILYRINLIKTFLRIYSRA